MDMGARVRVWVSNSLSQAEASSQPEGGQQVQGTHLAQRVACGDKPYDKPNG